MKKKVLLVSSAFTTTLISANSIGYALWFLNESKSNEFATIEFDNKNAKPVAYIEGQESTKYTSIEKALKVAENDSNNNTIYVIPGTNPIIEGECLVDTGDTLVFPYDGTTWQDSTRNVTNDNFADSSLEQVNQNRKNLITLKKDATLINKGTILIGGIIGTSSMNNTRQRPTGHTVGSYVELRMEEQSKLSNYGNITCYGYIKPNKIFTINSPDQPEIENVGADASVTLPLVIYDYRGAKFSLGAVGTKIMPFNIFDFPNSQVKMIFDNQSCLNTTVTLYSTGFDGFMEGIQMETLKLIDQEDAIFICKDGTIEMKYNSSKYSNGEFFTTNDSSTDTTSDNFNKTQVNVLGNFEFSSTQMTLAGLLDINTADYYLPFSYKYDINIISGESNIRSKLKFLKGSSLTINQSGTLNIDSNVSFYSTYVDQSQYAEPKYPRDVSQALLVNNGTLNINSDLSGFITSQSDNAIINISSDVNLSTSVDELLDASLGSGLFDKLKMTATYRTVNGVAYGYIANSDDFSDPFLCSFSNNSQYFSNSEGVWCGLQGNSDINESISNDKTKEFNITDLVDISICFDEKTTLITNQGEKSIKDIKENDEVLTFNHFENKFEMQKIILKISHKERMCNSIKLNFENNYTITVINSHGFFNTEENKYISINQNNVASYVNKNFLIHKDNQLSKVKLLSYEITREIKKGYAIITNKNYNAVCNKLLNVTDITDALYNLFPYDKNHCYSKEMVNHIIKKYGYLKYEHFKSLISEDLFNAFNGKYFIQKFISGCMNINLLTKYLEIVQKYNEIGEVEFAAYFN